MSQPPPEGPGRSPDPEQPPSPYEQPGGEPSWQQPGPAEPSWQQQGGGHSHWGQQPPYAPQVPHGQYGPPSSGTRLNVPALLSLVFAFVFAPAGIVLGHVARRQIPRTGEEGAALATWGLVLSYVFTGLYLLFCLGWLALLFWVGSPGGTGSYN